MQSGHANDGSNWRTVVTLRTYTFNWTIENFSKIPSDKEIVGPTFHPRLNYEFQATLTKHHGACNLAFKKISSLSGFKMKHSLYIIDSTKRVFFNAVAFHTYGSHTDLICNASTDFTISKMKEVCNSIKDDVLTFECVMEWAEVQTPTEVSRFRPKPVSELQNLLALSTDLKSMYGVSLYADVSLKVGDSIVRVHKSVMCARSPVFEKMFKTPMGESEKNVIVISDLEMPVLKDLVTFMYTGVLVKDDFESMYALYYAADKYDVSTLRKTCADVLLSKLDTSNACRVLALADQHSDAEFKESVMDFLKFYHNEILDTDAWDEFVENATLLAAEVMALRGKKRKAELTETDSS